MSINNGEQLLVKIVCCGENDVVRHPQSPFENAASACTLLTKSLVSSINITTLTKDFIAPATVIITGVTRENSLRGDAYLEQYFKKLNEID